MQIPGLLLLLLLLLLVAAGFLLVGGGWWLMAAPPRCLAVSGPCCCCVAGLHTREERAGLLLPAWAWCGVAPLRLPACLTRCLRRVRGGTR